MKAVFAILTTLALVPFPALARDRTITISEQKLISDAFGKQLKDPGSAQYKWPALPKSDKNKQQRLGYCFEVNAKNSFGGYVGFKPIVGIVTEQNGRIISFEYTTGLSDSDPMMISLNNRMCEALGIKL
jgi:hypothetical protein